MEQRYANLLFDDAFKVVVCAPGNERLLIKLIETLIPERTIKHLELMDKENHGLSVSDKISTFDLYCTSEDGEQFIVEMQNSPQKHYADRMLCYATFPIRNQLAEKLSLREERIKRGKSVDKMDYGLLPVYVVSILNFSIAHTSDDIMEENLISRYDIRSGRNGELMTDSLHFVFLELGRLKVKKGDVLRMLFDASEFANMDPWQQYEYDNVMRTELDIIAEKAYAREEGYNEGKELGLSEGRAEGQAEGALKAAHDIADKMLAEGIPIETVQKVTGLSL